MKVKWGGKRGTRGMLIFDSFYRRGWLSIVLAVQSACACAGGRMWYLSLVVDENRRD